MQYKAFFRLIAIHKSFAVEVKGILSIIDYHAVIKLDLRAFLIAAFNVFITNIHTAKINAVSFFLLFHSINLTRTMPD